MLLNLIASWNGEIFFSFLEMEGNFKETNHGGVPLKFKIKFDGLQNKIRQLSNSKIKSFLPSSTIFGVVLQSPMTMCINASW